KANSQDVLCRITAINRGPDAAAIHILPHLWYRNTWSWEVAAARPVIRAVGPAAAHTTDPDLGERWWYVRSTDNQPVELLFTENDTNLERLYNVPNPTPYVKDGINDAVVNGRTDRVNRRQGSKLAGHAHAVVASGGALTVEVRFSAEPLKTPFARFKQILARRSAETDAYYAALHPAGLSDDERL